MHFIRAFLFSVALSFSLVNVYSQNTCHQAAMIVKTAQKYHCEPRPVDDAFAGFVFNEFINLLDPDGLVLSSAEVEQLKALQNTIDDDILAERCGIVDKAVSLYTRKLTYTDSLVNSYRKTTPDFRTTESLDFSEDNVYVTPVQFNERWRKWMKMEVLYSYVASRDSIETPPMPVADSLTTILKETIESELCWIKSRMSYTGGIEQYVGSNYLKAVATAFDPHTEYFSPEEENEFWSDLSRETYSFGFEVDRNDMGEIEIYGITPGSPAWKSNALNEGDVILSAKTSSGQTKEFNCLPMEEVVKFISSEDVKEASFQVRKVNRKEVLITLEKEKSNVEENVIKSFVLDGKQKIGYIYLPAFYSDMENVNGLPKGCATDVAKELIKLKKENISGLILDLRDNGGGSVLEAIQLAGIFIDYGALGIVSVRGEEPETMKDLNRGTVYNDPLLILQNPFSASASEIFAGAMQDYNRAVIAGARSYGKATVQDVIPIDAYKYNTIDDATTSTEGYLKLTISKFYRVKGNSYQFGGIVPDVQLPDLYQDLNLGESSFPSALAATTIDKKTYYYPSPPLPLNELKARSEERIKNDSAFSHINSWSKTIAAEQKHYSIPLQYDAFIKYYNSGTEEDDEYEASAVKQDTLFTVQNPDYIKGVSSIDNPEKEIDEHTMLQLQHDTHVKESYHIITDLINLNAKN